MSDYLSLINDLTQKTSEDAAAFYCPYIPLTPAGDSYKTELDCTHSVKTEWIPFKPEIKFKDPDPIFKTQRQLSDFYRCHGRQSGKTLNMVKSLPNNEFSYIFIRSGHMRDYITQMILEHRKDISVNKFPSFVVRKDFKSIINCLKEIYTVKRRSFIDNQFYDEFYIKKDEERCVAMIDRGF